MRAIMLMGLTVLAISAGLHAAESSPAVKRIETFGGPSDFSWVRRDGYKLPAFKSEKPRFTFWALGDGQRSVMLLAWDESQGTGKGYDTFYFDKNFNADLTEAAEQFSAALKEGASFETGAIKEADGDRQCTIKYVREKDNFGWQSQFQMNGPRMAWGAGLLPGNLKVQWTNDLKTAPVYRLGGGEPILSANGKKPGEALGKFTAGSMAGVHTTISVFGNELKNELRFYHSHAPGARDPLIGLRVLDARGTVIEDIPFAGGCGCAGSFGQELLVPSRVPPGRHVVAIRVNRAGWAGGPAEFIFPVEVENPDFGKPLQDPAFAALKAKAPDAKLYSLRRAATPQQAAPGFPGEQVVGSAAADATLYGGTRDWNMSNHNSGGEPFNGLGTQIHHHNDSRTLMKFDLRALPKDAKIAGAHLRLTFSNQPYTGAKADARIEAFAVQTEWVEGEATWNGPKRNAKWTAPGCGGAGADCAGEAAASAELANFPAKGERYRFIALDLTELARAWAAGRQANHGVLLKFSGGGCAKFCGHEFQDYPFRPTLVVALEGGGAIAAAPAAPAGEDYPAALAAAQASGKPLAVAFYSPTCGVCKAVDRTTYASTEVQQALAAKYHFVRVKVEDQAKLAQELGVGSVPALVLLQADGKTTLGLLGSEVLKARDRTLQALADPGKPGALAK